MKTISTYLGHINRFSELNAFADNLEVDISFFGYSYIKKNDYKGVVHVDALLKRFDDLLKINRRNGIVVSDSEEKQYPKILKKVRVIYETHDAIYKRSNLITKIFWQVRTFFSDWKALKHGYPLRARWDLGVWENLENPPIPKPGPPPNQGKDFKEFLREMTLALGDKLQEPDDELSDLEGFPDKDSSNIERTPFIIEEFIEDSEET